MSGTALATLLSFSGCTGASSRITDYLSEVAPPPTQPPPLGPSLNVGLILAMPEAELTKETAPSKAFQEKLTERLQKGISVSPRVQIKQRLSPITLLGAGLGAFPIARLRELAGATQLNKILVVVATSKSAQRVLPYPHIVTQLFARMDLALVDLPTGQVLLTEMGQEDYFLEDRTDGVRDIRFPRLYYRDITTSGPFQVVDGKPFIALGEEAFSRAADQLVMRLLEQLNESQ